jgi:hypothetical protein
MIIFGAWCLAAAIGRWLDRHPRRHWQDRLDELKWERAAIQARAD